MHTASSSLRTSSPAMSQQTRVRTNRSPIGKKCPPPPGRGERPPTEPRDCSAPRLRGRSVGLTTAANSEPFLPFEIFKLEETAHFRLWQIFRRVNVYLRPTRTCVRACVALRGLWTARWLCGRGINVVTRPRPLRRNVARKSDADLSRFVAEQRQALARRRGLGGNRPNIRERSSTANSEEFIIPPPPLPPDNIKPTKPTTISNLIAKSKTLLIPMRTIDCQS